MQLALLMKAWSLLASLRNRLLNLAATALCGSPTAVDWRDLKIVHPQGIRIGKNFSSGRSLWLESVQGQGRLTIGEDVNLSDWVHIACANQVTIGPGTLIGSKVIITDHSHGAIDAAGIAELDRMPNDRTISSKGAVMIGSAVWLGDGVCVMPGVSIGDRAVVGANSVVTKSIPPGTVWAGVPARQIWPQAE